MGWLRLATRRGNVYAIEIVFALASETYLLLCLGLWSRSESKYRIITVVFVRWRR
jgi:hypothetical protein